MEKCSANPKCIEPLPTRTHRVANVCASLCGSSLASSALSLPRVIGRLDPTPAAASFFRGDALGGHISRVCAPRLTPSGPLRSTTNSQRSESKLAPPPCRCPAIRPKNPKDNFARSPSLDAPNHTADGEQPRAVPRERSGGARGCCVGASVGSPSPLASASTRMSWQMETGTAQRGRALGATIFVGLACKASTLHLQQTGSYKPPLLHFHSPKTKGYFFENLYSF